MHPEHAIGQPQAPSAGGGPGAGGETDPPPAPRALQPPVHAYAAAGGVVVDAAGQRVLVLLRPGRPGPQGQVEVRLPKGHIEAAESPRQAALREVQEESGLRELFIVADLDHQIVEFDWRGIHHVRDESYFLMQVPDDLQAGSPEKQFVPLWLPWEEAVARLTFEAEQEWVRRAQVAWSRRGG
jgi:8-oxo-dGTP pyrophosphatase MutT (NUDIX family)